jgi:hypothetical protein
MRRLQAFGAWTYLIETRGSSSVPVLRFGMCDLLYVARVGLAVLILAVLIVRANAVKSSWSCGHVNGESDCCSPHLQLHSLSVRS